MSLNKYRALLKSMELKNMTKAGELLGYTHAGISYMITSLEKDFGFPLLTRTKDGVIPTENALKLKPILNQLLSNEIELTKAIGEINGIPGGKIQVGSCSNLLLNGLPQILENFFLLYPEVEISLIEGDASTLEKYLAEGSIDMAFMPTPIPEEYGFTKLITDSFLGVLYEGHPLCTESILSMEQLCNYPFIVSNESYHDIFRRYLSTALNPKQNRFTYSVKDSSSVLSMVSNEFGISVLPQTRLHHLPHNIILKKLSWDFSRDFGIAFHDKKYLSPAVRDFIAISQKVLGKINGDILQDMAS